MALFAYTSGVFYSALVEDLGWRMSELSFAFFVTSMAAAIMVPVMGIVMDRRGAVAVIVFSLSAEVAGFTAIGLMPADYWYFLALQTLIMFFGCGATAPSFARIITAHFRARRGLALGISLSSSGIVAIVAPVLLTRTVDAVGWRQSYLLLASVIALVGVVAISFIWRADQTVIPSPRGRAQPVREARSGSFAFLRHPRFWLLAAGVLPPAFLLGGYLIHLIQILKEQGFSGTQAAGVQSAIGAAVIAGRLSTGVLLDRFFPPYIAAATFAISAAGCALLATGNPQLAWIAALAIGVSIGAELDLTAYLVSYYFGVEGFGRIYGTLYGALVVSAGFSPFLISTIAEGGGGYGLALIISAAGTLAGSAILLFAPRAVSRA